MSSSSRARSLHPSSVSGPRINIVLRGLYDEKVSAFKRIRGAKSLAVVLVAVVVARARYERAEEVVEDKD